MSSSDIDSQLVEVGALLGSRIDELARQVVQAVRANVEFYRNNHLVSDYELQQASTEHLRLLAHALQGAPFDSSQAAALGVRRAAAGVPLPAVMSSYRIGHHHVWDTMVQLAGESPNISSAAMQVATSKVWQAQDIYTDAMAAAYHKQATNQRVEDALEQAALAEALLEGRPLDDFSLWEVAQLLQIPSRGPFIVVAARPPRVGRQALPGIGLLLLEIGVHSAWRLLPDIQIGIAHLPSEAALHRVIESLDRVATLAVGVSPSFDDLADTAKSLRYARVAMDSGGDGGRVTVFEDSILGVAAVSAPDVTRKLAQVTLGSFDDLPSDEKELLRNTFGAWLDAKGSPAGAAAALFCHPNTVRHRLRRIEDRTGRSLSTPRELAELCLAFEVVHLWASEPAAENTDPAG